MPTSSAASTRRRGARAASGQAESSISTDQLGVALESAAIGVEDHLLALVLQRPDLREFVEAVPPEHFLDTANRELFTCWSRVPTLEEMLELLSADLAEKADRLRSAPVPPSDHAQRVTEVTQCVRRLRERYMRNLLREAETVLKEAEKLRGRRRARGPAQQDA